MVCVCEDKFGSIQDPLTKKVVNIRRFTITNKHKLCIQVITKGATITSVKYPDKRGNIADICLGFNAIQDYINNSHTYMGAVLGRVANRINCGQFKMGSTEVCVSKNCCNKHHINGGFIGFDSVIWDVAKVLKNGVEMKHCSCSGHEGYPGDLTVCIRFTLDESNNFRMCIQAESSECTPVNISNNVYFNLAGHDQGKKCLSEHVLIIKADKVVDTDNEQIPTSLLMPVAKTPYDVRHFTNLGKVIKQFKVCPIHGIEKNYCVNVCAHQPETVAKIVHPSTGRWIEINTNQPTILLSTANDFPDIEATELPIIGKDGALYEKHGAFSFQTQQYPDAVNNKNFPQIILKPCEKYSHEVTFKFGACKICTRNPI